MPPPGHGSLGRRTVPVCSVQRGKAGRFAYADTPLAVVASSDSDCPYLIRAPRNATRTRKRRLGLACARAVLKIQIGIPFQTAFVLAQETHRFIRLQAI